MDLQIYNTLTRKKEPFVPLRAGEVKMYVCGPTVYDLCHIGNARSVVVFDVVARYLEHKGFQVTYVRNFTDVDDKIINRANALDISPETLATRYIDAFYADMDALNVRRATVEPLATDYIDSMRRFIERLIDKGMAYAVDGDVYFSVKNFKAYGKLSGRRLDDMEAGARVDIDTRKKNPFDFALWKSAKPGEPSWPSPWGPGRPGWHIECSAMSSEILGDTFDIHGGGKDLIFPHHENEIAQSEGATGKTFARYWMHNGYVNINREKMSKSLGNFTFTRDLLTRYHPEIIRLFLLSNQYRSPIDFSDQNLKEAGAGLEKVYTLLLRLDGALGKRPAPAGAPASGAHFDRFCQAMDDDFNTARGIGILFDAIHQANKMLDADPGADAAETASALQTIREDIAGMGRLLGILAEPADVFFENRHRHALAEAQIDEDRIEALIQQRADARKARDWARADRVRDELSDMGVAIEDRPEGTVWKIVK